VDLACVLEGAIPQLKDLTLSVRVHQRYRVIDQVRRGFNLLAAAERVGCHFTVAYDWVHRFNESGFGTFEQVPNPKGRPPILRASQLRELIDVALSSPSERGLPFSVWSVSKLAEYCRRRRLLPAVTDEWVRRLLRREGLTAQRVRTWKTSTDPAFDQRNRSADLPVRAVCGGDLSITATDSKALNRFRGAQLRRIG
jgi:transposase